MAHMIWKGAITSGLVHVPVQDKYVVLSDDEIRAANPESTQTVDILAFVDGPDISLLCLDTPYFVTPDRKGEKVHALRSPARRASAAARRCLGSNPCLSANAILLNGRAMASCGRRRS